MEMSSTSDQLLALGKRLTQELGSAREVDTLSRWMSHHISELMLAAENADDASRPAALRECRTAILDLWKHRTRPFEGLEPLLRTLEELASDSHRPRYFRAIRESGDQGEPSESQKWLRIASSIDEIARTLTLYSIGRAAEKEVDKANEWVRLATEAAAELDWELPLLRIVIRENGSVIRSPENVGKKTLLRSRLEQLDSFSKTAKAIRKEIQLQLDAIGDES